MALLRCVNWNWKKVVILRGYGEQMQSLGDQASVEILERVIRDEQEHYRVLARLASTDASPRDPKEIQKALDALLEKREKGRVQAGSWLGDAIYGVNDGLGSIFGIVSGVSGATLGNSRFVLIAGLAGMVASALSMGAGAYLAAKSEREFYEAEFAREAKAVRLNPVEARELLSLTYQVRGLPQEDADRVVEHLASDDGRLAEALARERLNTTEESLSNPLTSAFSGALSTAVGALIPIVPFLLYLGLHGSDHRGDRVPGRALRSWGSKVTGDHSFMVVKRLRDDMGWCAGRRGHLCHRARAWAPGRRWRWRCELMTVNRRVEYAAQRKMRTRNTVLYRILHWPLWIFVFFLVPGPLVFDVFAGRGNHWNLLWLALVLLGTGVAALRGRLPGAEPAPYILRFTEDRPNPLYRRVCYTFGWNAAVNFALMNLIGCVVAVVTGRWFMQQIYSRVYFLVLLAIVLLGIAGKLPRVGSSTAGEGTERRYFYGTVWSVTLAQAVLMVLWKALPRGHGGDVIKLLVYMAALGAGAVASHAGLFPRTRPIVPGELVVAD